MNNLLSYCGLVDVRTENKCFWQRFTSKVFITTSGAPYQVRTARPKSYLDFPEKRGEEKGWAEHDRCSFLFWPLQKVFRSFLAWAKLWSALLLFCLFQKSLRHFFFLLLFWWSTYIHQAKLLALRALLISQSIGIRFLVYPMKNQFFCISNRTNWAIFSTFLEIIFHRSACRLLGQWLSSSSGA